MNRKSQFILSLVALALLTSCGGGSNQPQAEPTGANTQSSAQEVLSAINVQMHDIYFGDDNNNLQDPPVWTVPAGQAIAMTYDNKGGLEHSWAVLKQGAEMPMPYTDANADLLLHTSGNIQPGQQARGTFTAPSEAGEYIVFCTVAGHYPVMQGRLIVE